MTSELRIPSWQHDVRAADMVPLARILRDPNPIHLDPEAVTSLGLGNRVINQGPANLAYVINMLERAFPNHRLEALETRFLANIRDGDTVEARGTILERDGDRVLCEASLEVAGGTPAVKVRATLVPRAS